MAACGVSCTDCLLPLQIEWEKRLSHGIFRIIPIINWRLRYQPEGSILGAFLNLFFSANKLFILTISEQTIHLENRARINTRNMSLVS